ncbi:MAG: hypothetical protein DBY17_08540 [Oscillospiraceae bacterium]|nr:MAG: hypothetical protein DBY17_08540 [Oscillospiraceae bacterium]
MCDAARCAPRTACFGQPACTGRPAPQAAAAQARACARRPCGAGGALFYSQPGGTRPAPVFFSTLCAALRAPRGRARLPRLFGGAGVCALL